MLLSLFPWVLLDALECFDESVLSGYKWSEVLDNGALWKVDAHRQTGKDPLFVRIMRCLAFLSIQPFISVQHNPSTPPTLRPPCFLETKLNFLYKTHEANESLFHRTC